MAFFCMQKTLLFVDKLSTWVGQFFSWLIVALTVLITWEVFSRYALDRPHDWMFDTMIQMYGTLFMMAGAYTLAKNGHVRGDVLYSFFQPRTQATWDLILYIVFFLPGSRCPTRTRLMVPPRKSTVASFPPTAIFGKWGKTRSWP